MTPRFPNQPLCPVCHNPVQSTTPTIRSHNDKAGHHCPASGEPFRIALTDHMEHPR